MTVILPACFQVNSPVPHGTRLRFHVKGFCEDGRPVSAEELTHGALAFLEEARATCANKRYMEGRI